MVRCAAGRSSRRISAVLGKSPPPTMVTRRMSGNCGKQRSEGSSVTLQDEALQAGRPQHEAFESLQRRCVEPAQQRRPLAGRCAGLDALRQAGPVNGGIGVMLGVVAVVETQKVVDAPIVAGGLGPRRVPSAPASRTTPARRDSPEDIPAGKSADAARPGRTTGKGPARSRRRGAVKRAIAMRRRHDAPDDGRATASAECPAARSGGGEQPVHPGRSEKGPVDEIVRDGVGVPPHSEGDDGRQRPQDEDASVQCRQRHQNRVAAGEPPHSRRG